MGLTFNAWQISTINGPKRARIEKAQRDLRDGASFGEVAHRYSDGLHAGNGGSWGWVRRGTLRKRFEPAVEALFSLETGAVSDITETDRGFYIVRCDEKDDGDVPGFVTLQPELNNRFRRNMFNHLVSELVDELQEKSRVTPEDLDRFWRAAVREGERIVEAAKNGPPPP